MRTFTATTFCAILVLGMGISVALAAPGDILLEYRSNTGLMPGDFGWTQDGRSLEEHCPLNETPPTCDFYGAEDKNPLDGAADNDGTMLPINDSGGGFVNQLDPPTGTNNNAPAAPFEGYDVCYVWKGSHPTGGAETYSEWFEFDDDADNLEHVATLSQHLPHGATPKGAVNFPGAPAHNVLRLVGGDGNGIDLSLPHVASFNNQKGKVRIKKSHDVNGITTSVFRGALSRKNPGDRTDTFLETRATKSDGSAHLRIHFIHFTDRDLPPGCTDCGRIGVRNDASGEAELIGSPDPGWTVDPETFFTLRAVIDPDAETVTVVLNEGTPEQRETTLDNNFITGGWEKRVGSTGYQTTAGLWSTGDYVVWIDYIEVYEGAAGPNPCLWPDPVFDIAGGAPDGMVDQQDYAVFEDCATGPAPLDSVFDALPQECQCMDVNGDRAVDHQDFGAFQSCVSGILPVDPTCDDGY